MKNILVPCDFSAPAVEALKFAATLARQNKAELQVIHAIELPAMYDSSAILLFEQEYMKDQKAKAQRKLMNLLDSWGKGIKKAKIIVEFGGVIPVVEKAIRKSGADLVVMGTHGASGIKEYTIGSNAEKIVRRSKVPVIAVKRSVNNIRNIVFPVYPGADQQQLVSKVKEIQNIFKAKLHVLFVNTPGMFHRDADILPKLQAFAKRYTLSNFTINVVNDTDEVEGIIHFTKRLEDPFVTMKTRGRLGIAHLASASIAEDVVNHIACPVWTFKTR